jgi:hypothetical protein
MNKFEMIRRIYNNIPPDPVPKEEEFEEFEEIKTEPIGLVCRVCEGGLGPAICDYCRSKLRKEQEASEKRIASLVNSGIGAGIGIALFNSMFKKDV